MRAMSEVPQDEEEDERVNIIYSPTNSATTGFSGGSSLGLHYKGAWCTPPRIFIDQVILDDKHTTLCILSLLYMEMVCNIPFWRNYC
jgi:hypothetical protein